MTAPSQPRYANTGPVAEFVIREQIVEGLIELRDSPQQLGELTTRFDSMPQGSETEWSVQCRAMLLHMLDPEGGEFVTVSLGHPSSDATLPWVGIVHRGESEDMAAASMGDVLDVQNEHIGTSDDLTHFHIRKHITRGVTVSSQVEIAVWAVSAEASVILHEAVQYVLFRRKGHIAAAGVRDMVMRTDGFEPREDMLPRVSYVPTVTLTCSVQRRAVVTRDNIPHQVAITFTFSSS
jgi:hypothetical protein